MTTQSKGILPLKIGFMYEAVDIAGVKIQFIVQEKPSLLVSSVKANLIQTKKLPDHLRGDDWYSIKNLKTKKCLWLHAPSYKITRQLKEMS